MLVRNSLTLILVFQVASQKPEVFFFTDAYKCFRNICEENTAGFWLATWNIKINAITKVSTERSNGCFRIKIFFLQVNELNNKLDELSLKGCICICALQSYSEGNLWIIMLMKHFVSFSHKSHESLHNSFHPNCLTHFWPTFPFHNPVPFPPPKTHTTKSIIFWCFQRVRNRNIG